ncbi:MAG TPA: hypothetical protein VFN35_12765, partial [Ktedonobacteraceae bacterium]|nr:hypothetical protein [Ktedonobacteraceae bacterium]
LQASSLIEPGEQLGNCIPSQRRSVSGELGGSPGPHSCQASRLASSEPAPHTLSPLFFHD